VVSWQAKLRGWLVELARPFPPPNYALGIYMSPLDAFGATQGEQAVKNALQLPGVRRMAAALKDFLADERADIALAKACHATFEQRLRVVALHEDPPTDYGFGAGIAMPPLGHPLDRVARQVLRADPSPSGTSRMDGGSLRVLVGLLLAATWLVVEAAVIGWRFGQGTVTTSWFRIGAPSQIFRRWAVFRDAAAALGVWRDDALLLVAEEEGLTEGPGWLAQVRLAGLPVEARRWRAETLAPCVILAMRAVAGAIRGMRDPWTLQAAAEAVGLARESLPIQRLLHSHRFKWYLDVEEYTGRHVVRAIVLGRFGAGLVRWPHAVMDTPGASMSWLMYDLFLCFGPYERLTLGQTWRPDGRAAVVGLVQNDRRMAQQVTRHYRETIEAFKATGGKVVAYFLPSVMEGREPLIAATLDVLLRVFASRPDWLLLVKPKGIKSTRQLDSILSSTPDLAEALKIALVVRYENVDQEPCPVGWAISQIELGVGIGTVPFEMLSRGKPAFVHYPVIHPTPATERLVACGLMHNTPAAFEEALQRWLAAPASFSVPYDWFRDMFDPFLDDQALTRVAEQLLLDHGAARNDRPQQALQAS